MASVGTAWMLEESGSALSLQAELLACHLSSCSACDTMCVYFPVSFSPQAGNLGLGLGDFGLFSLGTVESWEEEPQSWSPGTG